MRIKAGPERDGMRADAWAAVELGVSRKRAVIGLKSGLLTINGLNVKPSRHVKEGDVLEGAVPPGEPVSLVPEDSTVPIVFQDSHILVVDKPPGLVVHPGAGRRGGTLANFLLGMGIELAGAAGRLRPGIVHRLDKDTSGLLVVAKTDEAYWKLVKMVAERQVERRYFAVVAGIPRPPKGTIEAALGRDSASHEKFTVVSHGGRWSVTHYEVSEKFADASLVRVRLGTGRTHQIRVHFSAMKWPILGDRVYGGSRGRTALIARQALHAESLSFPHPVTGEHLEFTSPPPEDMRFLIESLRKQFSGGGTKRPA